MITKSEELFPRLINKKVTRKCEVNEFVILWRIGELRKGDKVRDHCSMLSDIPYLEQAR